MAALRYVSGTKLDERIIRCDLDLGYSEGRQFGRGKSGGQVCAHFFLGPGSGVTPNPLVRFATNTAKIMTLEGVVGEPKRRRPSDYEENFIPMLWTDQVLWPAVVVIGRTVAEVRVVEFFLSGMQTLFQSQICLGAEVSNGREATGTMTMTWMNLAGCVEQYVTQLS